jgi:hypothetical protein
MSFDENTFSRSRRPSRDQSVRSHRAERHGNPHPCLEADTSARLRSVLAARHVDGARQARSVDSKALVVPDVREKHERLPCEGARLAAIQVGADEMGGSERGPVKPEDGDLIRRTAVLS